MLIIKNTFIFSEKATKFCEIFTLLLCYVVLVKSKVKVSQNFVTFSEYRTRAIITRGLYTFYPLFEVHLCTVTFGLMYG